MPTKPIPQKMVERLKRIGLRIEPRLLKLKNADHRMRPSLAKWYSSIPKEPINKELGIMQGHRVRELNVKRNSPRQRIILKAAHVRTIYRMTNEEIDGHPKAKRDYQPMTAQQTIDEVNAMVEKYTKYLHRHDCILLKPNAYAISDKLIAMSRANYPPVVEVVTFPKHLHLPTAQGRRMLKRLETAGFTPEIIRASAEEISQRTGFSYSNLMIIGIRKGKLVFMPYVDIE